MAIDQNLAMFLENAGENYNAREFRAYFQDMMGYDLTTTPGTAAGGVFRPADLAVTQVGPDMSVNVAAGSAYVQGSEYATQGGYFVANETTVNVLIAAADLTNPRKDLIGIRIRDSEYSGSLSDAQIIVVTGAPAASPAEPTVPANFLTLALIDVPAGDMSIETGQITDRRRRMSALGGITVCTSTTRPSVNLWAGQVIYETDTSLMLAYDGTAFRPFMAVDSYTTAAGKWDLLGTLNNPGSGQTQIGGTIDSTKHASAIIMGNLSNATGSASDIGIRFNNTATATYYVDIVYTSDSGVPTAYHVNTTFARLGYSTATSETAFRGEVPELKATTYGKELLFQSHLNDPGVLRQMEAGATMWTGAPAITRIDLYIAQAMTGQVRLYGVRA